MNWTGGNLQRHSKSKGNAVVVRQKSHFAKARSKAPKTQTRPVEGWDDTSSMRDSSPPPLKRIRTRASPRIQEWSISGQKTGQRLEGDFVLPSRESEVRVRVGKRAFASQLDTTVASPSTRIRSPTVSHSDHSTNSMLLDDLDQTDSRSKASYSGRSYRATMGPGNSLTPPCVVKHMQFALSDSLDGFLRNHKGGKHPTGSEAHASSMVGNAASSGDASNNTSAEDMQSSPDAAERLKASPVKPRLEHSNISCTHVHADATSFSHEDSEDNDITWRRFIEEEEEVEVGQTGSDLYTAPQYMMQASPNALPTWKLAHEEPLYPSTRACLLETGTSKRIGGETSGRWPRLSDEDQGWMRFVLGLDYTDGSLVGIMSE
ncbi:hypothetical protein E4T39_02819 [Aureobasidium subglaciale]|nr:hypothetical protein E4T39_02819 [Aureobasidium subglaciale]